jgi:hypothetical protein
MDEVKEPGSGFVIAPSRYGAGFRLILSEMTRKNRRFRHLPFAESVLSRYMLKGISRPWRARSGSVEKPPAG